MTEQVIFLNKLKTRQKLGEFDHLYFGADYCPHLMPNLAEITKAYELSLKQDIEFTLVTPLCYEILRPRLEGLIANFADQVPMAEVVVNDWGIFEFVEGVRNLTPVIGRLLTRTRRFGQVLSLDQNERKHFATIPLAHPRISRWLTDKGVKRLEFDGSKGIDYWQLNETNLKGSVYLPYSVVSITRYCSAAYDREGGWQNYRNCAKACEDNVLYLTNPELHKPLIVKGCVRLFEQTSYFDEDGSASIDRLVFWPEAL